MSNVIKTKISGKQIIDGSVTRSNLDTSIVQDIDTLKQHDLDQIGQISQLQSDVSAEQAARVSADSALGLRVDEVAGDLSDEVAARTLAVSTEVSAREAADLVLQGNIDAEALSRSSADAALGLRVDGVVSDLSDETAARAASAVALQGSIEDEAAARVAGDTALDLRVDGVAADLASEVTARGLAVTGEASARAAADVVLQGNIDAEASARAAADLALSGRLDTLEQDPTTKSYVDQKVADLVNSAPAVLDTLKELSDAIGEDPNFATTVANQVGTVAANLADEVSAREAADLVLQGNIDAEVAARFSALSAEEGARVAADAALGDALAAEVLRAEQAEGALSGRLDDIEADVVPTINGRLDVVESNTDQNTFDISNLTSGLQSEVSARQAADLVLQGNIDAEVSARTAGDSALNTRLVKAEDLLKTPVDVVWENNSSVFADARPGVVDPSSALREGWYFQNVSAGQKINWYFYDGQANNVTVANFSAYAVVTVDSLSSMPFLVIYTTPTGSGDAGAWFKSSRVFYMPSAGTVVGKKYLIYVGQNPSVHPEMPHVQCTPGTQVGTFASTERVMTAAFNTNSAASVNGVKLVVDRLGVMSPSFVQEIALRIRSASQVSLDAEVAARTAADSVLQSNINSEASARVAADNALSARIDGLESSGNGTSGDLQQEIQDRIAGDAATLSSANSYTDGKVADLVNSAPTVLDTLKELADALGQDPNFATTVAGQIGDVAADLASEVARATAAEGVLSGDLAAEVARATAAESALSGRVTALESVSTVVREKPTGDIDGVNKVFVLAKTPKSDSEMVFLNGILQEPGASADYVISGKNITFAVAPVQPWGILVTYLTLE